MLTAPASLPVASAPSRSLPRRLGDRPSPTRIPEWRAELRDPNGCGRPDRPVVRVVAGLCRSDRLLRRGARARRRCARLLAGPRHGNEPLGGDQSGRSERVQSAPLAAFYLRRRTTLAAGCLPVTISSMKAAHFSIARRVARP